MLRMQKSRLSNLLLVSVAGLLLAACSTVPLDFPRQYSETLTDTADTPLAVTSKTWVDRHDGLSGFYPLIKGLDALGIRLAMIDLAERSIDAQYFLMKPDHTGRLFADKLLDAADRGVRVRMLLDDIFTTVKDDMFIVMSQHPNIEIRLFNPISRRGSYYINYLGSFKLTNRRMHNKSLIVDNAFSIVGGRNIADEYFEILDDKEFTDFDMLAMGPVAGQVSAAFDRFWNHKLAVPMEVFDVGRKNLDLAEARAAVDKRADETGATIYGYALSSPLLREIRAQKIKLFAGPGEVITDDPDKLLRRISPVHQTLVTKMVSIVRSAGQEVMIATPYFIPRKAGVEFWRSIVEKGVRVVVLTNSLASNNHPATHAAYARYRKDIIKAGVELYETRVDKAMQPPNENDKTYETTTLHIKGAVIDRRYTFAGSLNLDPRSIELNSELGLLVDNQEMADSLMDLLQSRMPSLAYKVTLNDKGKLRWTTHISGVETVETREPQAGWWLRFKAFMARIVPESQL